MVWSWFKFNNLGLTLGVALKFCNSVTNGLKLKNRKWGLTLTFLEVTEEKVVGRGGDFLIPLPILNRVKIAVLKFVDLINKNVCGGLQF